jgi:hypothetical protein
MLRIWLTMPALQRQSHSWLFACGLWPVSNTSNTMKPISHFELRFVCAALRHHGWLSLIDTSSIARNLEPQA